MESLLKIENNYSFLSANDDIKSTLHKKLRFKAKGAWFHPLVKARKWDGFTEFFKRETGRFLTGLLPEVKAFLNATEKPYKILDTRERIDFSGVIDESFLGDNVKLRDYQVDYANQSLKYQRGIIPAPTGSGKSLLGVAIIKSIKPKTPMLFLANRTDLIEQMYESLVANNVPNIGRFYGKIKEPNYITCCTVQSAHLLLKALHKFKAIIGDEVHDLITKESKAIFSKLTNASLRIGMSATPFKDNGEDPVQKFEVKGWFGPLFKSKFTESGVLTTKELQDRDILSESFCQFLEIDKPELLYEIYLDAMIKGIAKNEYLNERVRSIVNHCKGRTLILVEHIEHGDRLQEMMPGILWVRGQDNRATRKSIIDRLKTDQGNTIAVATRGIFNTGIDVFVHNLINAAGGQAHHLIIQRFGRGLRRAVDKELLYYYDFFFKNNDYLEKHSKKRIKILEKEGHKVEVHKQFESLKFR